MFVFIGAAFTGLANTTSGRPKQDKPTRDPYSDAIAAICMCQGAMGTVCAAGMLSPHPEIAAESLVGFVNGLAKTSLMITELIAQRDVAEREVWLRRVDAQDAEYRRLTGGEQKP